MRIQWMSILLLVVAGCADPAAAKQELNARIGPPVPKMYENIQDGQDWLNPYLSVCSEGVELSVKSIRREPQTLKIQELREILRALPVGSWPYGRIIAIQECSIGFTPRQLMSDVQDVLRSLGLAVSHWPS